MFDTRQTDYRTTHASCPFHKDPRADAARASLDAYGAIIVVADLPAACRIANDFAPDALMRNDGVGEDGHVRFTNVTAEIGRPTMISLLPKARISVVNE